ncbi:hypothetical protein [Arthrobacter sp. H41]|uniref:hypothetical protein n=1 Tax=Arthrobacter sp. H41 TaxID=1312978 RepID=UPI000478A719|nr:hypothetical protein [Arthrobacter sp. H41]
MAWTVHVHVPVRVRVRGVPDEESVRALAAAVRRQVSERMAYAEQVLADLQRPADLRSPPSVAREAPIERFERRRDLPEGYAVPSYGRQGEPVAVPLRRLLVPGQDWRVLRALTLELPVGSFLDVVEQVSGVRGRDPAFAPLLPWRVLYADLEAELRHVTVWLVETERTTTLGELGGVVMTRAGELLRLGKEVTLAHVASPFDDLRQILGLLDPTGRVQRLPTVTVRNARRVHGSGGSAELLHGSWILWAGMALPEIKPTTLLDLGPVVQTATTVADMGVMVDPAAFESAYGLAWDAFVAEAGDHAVRLDLMPLRVKHDVLLEAVHFLAREAYAASGVAQSPMPGLVPVHQLFDAGDPACPEPLARPGRGFAAGLAPLAKVPPPRHPATGARTGPGTVGVLATAYLPVDAEILSAARQRPIGRRLAAEARALLAADVSDRHWKYRFYEWVGRRFGTSPVEARPIGGTAFEYVLAELEDSGDLDRLFDAVEGSGWTSVRIRLLWHCHGTSYASHPRVVALLRQLQSETLAGRENTYHITVDASQPGGIDLRHRESKRVTPGLPGRGVLGDVDSIFIFERDIKAMKPDATARLRAALEASRGELLAELASGRMSAVLTQEDFLREAIGRAAVAAHIREDDFVDQTVQRSLRILEVHRRDLGLMPSWDVTMQLVDRIGGTAAWVPVGQPFTETSDDFEARLIFWRLGRAGEVYQAMLIGITVVGGLLVAWEAGLIAALVQAAGGTTVVLVSIGISELIYIIRIIFFDAELSVEGFLMAAVEGYLGALGFRGGALAAAPIGRAIGTTTVRRVWSGIVLEKLVAGSVGGGISEGLTLFARDFVDVIIRDGHFHAAADYARRIGIGAAMGVLGEFTISPVLHHLGGRGLTAVASAADLVQQLRREGFALSEFTSAATGALSRLSRSTGQVLTADAAGVLLTAFRERVDDVITAWGRGVVARRVLELAAADLTRPAVAGLQRFLAAADDPTTQEAALRLATTFAAHPRETVHLLEVLSRMDEGVARRLMTGTFGSTDDVAAFIGRLGRYTPDQQRGALDLFGQLIDGGRGIVAQPPVVVQTAAQVRNAQHAAALTADARALRIEAEDFRRRAQEALDRATIADTYSRRRADALLEQAMRSERAAAERETLSASLAAGIDPRPPGSRIPTLRDGRPAGVHDPGLDAEVDEVFRLLEAGAGTARQPWIRIEADKVLGTTQTDAVVRTMFTSRSGNPVVFRIEGGTGAARSHECITIGSGGRVAVDSGDRALNINVGSFERAIEFIIAHRADGGRLRMFEIEEGWIRSLRGIATPERGHPVRVNELDPVTRAPIAELPPGGSISDVEGLARTVDLYQATDQLQIAHSLIGELREFIVQGTGRELQFVPRPATVRR